MTDLARVRTAFLVAGADLVAGDDEPELPVGLLALVLAPHGHHRLLQDVVERAVGRRLAPAGDVGAAFGQRQVGRRQADGPDRLAELHRLGQPDESDVAVKVAPVELLVQVHPLHVKVPVGVVKVEHVVLAEPHAKIFGRRPANVKRQTTPHQTEQKNALIGCVEGAEEAEEVEEGEKEKDPLFQTMGRSQHVTVVDEYAGAVLVRSLVHHAE